MKIIKKSNDQIKKEDAHGGSGSRKLYIEDNEFSSIQGMTYGWLPIGNKYAWHNHESIDEIMLVIKGCGTVKDEDGEYAFEPGDVFMYPATIFHEIQNNGDIEAEFVFVRIHK